MIPTIDPAVWLALALVFQPLIALIWLYVFVRVVTSHIRRSVAETVDERVNHAVDKIQN